MFTPMPQGRRRASQKPGDDGFMSFMACFDTRGLGGCFGGSTTRGGRKDGRKEPLDAASESAPFSAISAKVIEEPTPTHESPTTIMAETPMPQPLHAKQVHRNDPLGATTIGLFVDVFGPLPAAKPTTSHPGVRDRHSPVSQSARF